MAALAEAGHHATYQSTKEPGFKKRSSNLLTWCLPPAVTGRLERLLSALSIAAFL